MIKVATERTLVFGCLHAPYHDVKAFDTMLDFIKFWKPQRIISNGDQNDLWNCSKYFKFDSRKHNLDQEFEVGREVNSQLRLAAGKDAEIICNMGNHDARYDVYLQSNAPELARCERFKYDEVFGFNENNIRVNRGKRGTYARYQLGAIKIGHFETARMHSADTEQHLVMTGGCSIIASHSHRKGVFYKTLWDGSVLQGMGTGHLCDVSQADYVDDPNWQQGFILVNKLADRDRYHLTDMCIVGGNVLYEGRLF